MRIGSLFSGYAGLDQAVEQVFGAEPAWFVEYDAAPSKILAHHYPNVPNYGDVTTVDWASVPPVDILTGGFPCQDVSAAGKRAGLQAGTRTGLFHEVVKAIDTLRPQLAVLENVLGLLSADGEPWTPEVIALSDEAAQMTRTLNLIEKTGGYAWGKKYKDYERDRLVRQRDRALDRFKAAKRRSVQRAIGTVVGELAAIGYDATWTTIRASDVGAPHHRARVFILAEPADADGVGCGQGAGQPFSVAPEFAATVGGVGALPGRVGTDAPAVVLPTPRSSRGASATETMYAFGAVRDDTNRPQGEVVLPTPAACNPNDGEGVETWEARRRELAAKYGNNGVGMPLGIAVQMLPTPNASDGTGGGQHPSKREGHSRQLVDYALVDAVEWGKYAPAIHRWEALTRPAPAPTEPNRNGRPRLAAALPEWMMSLPVGWVTDVPGLSRAEQLKAIGNGVCPPQAVAAIRELLELRRLTIQQEAA